MSFDSTSRPIQSQHDLYPNSIWSQNELEHGLNTQICHQGSDPCDWLPAEVAVTAHERQWVQQSQQQRAKPIELDDQGMYEVKSGDSLWTIAARKLRGQQGAEPDRRSIQDEIEAIAAMNPHAILDCNHHLIHSGAKLKLYQYGQQRNGQTLEIPQIFPHSRDDQSRSGSLESHAKEEEQYKLDRLDHGRRVNEQYEV